MKQILFLKLLEAVKGNPKARKTLFITLGAVFSVALLGIAGLIWAGVSAFQYAQKNMPAAPTHLVQSVTQHSCWVTGLNLLQIEPWLTNSVQENIHQLVNSCLENSNTPKEEEAPKGEQISNVFKRLNQQGV